MPIGHRCSTATSPRSLTASSGRTDPRAAPSCVASIRCCSTWRCRSQCCCCCGARYARASTGAAARRASVSARCARAAASGCMRFRSARCRSRAILIAALRERDAASGDHADLRDADRPRPGRVRCCLASEVRYAPYDLPGCVRALPGAIAAAAADRDRDRAVAESAARGQPRRRAHPARECAHFGAQRRHLSTSARAHASGAGAPMSGSERRPQPTCERFAALGVAPERLMLAGNIKFDRTLPADIYERGALLRACYAAGRPVWVAGSTHAAEEPIVLRGASAAARERAARAADPRAAPPRALFRRRRGHHRSGLALRAALERRLGPAGRGRARQRP